MNNSVNKVQEYLTQQFKMEYLDENALNKAFKKASNKFMLSYGYKPKAVIDPYAKRIIKVEVVREDKK